MKQNRLIKFCLALVLAIISGASAFAQNEVTFSLGKQFIAPGETATVAVNVKTTTKIMAFSGRITLPEGLSFVSTEADPQKYEIEKTEFSKKSDIGFAGKTNQSAAFYVISSGTGFKASNDEVELFRVKVKAADNMKIENTITCTDFLGAYDYDAYEQDDFTSTWYNANYEATPTMADFSIKKGETKKVAVALNFDKDKIHSAQFDFVLPEGLTIDEDSYDVAERDTYHSAFAIKNNTGACVLAPLDEEHRFFTGTEGDFITFDITASEDFETSQFKIVNFMAASMTATYFGKDVVVNVTEGEATGINGINASEYGEGADGIYQLNGVRTDKMQRGVNIVVKDGKAIKVVKK